MLEFGINNFEIAEKIITEHRSEFTSDFLKDIEEMIEICRRLKKDKVRSEDYEKLKRLVKGFNYEETDV